jgi:hypothetical protein
MTPSRLAVVTAAAALLGLGATACGAQIGTTAGQPALQKLHLTTSPSRGVTPTPGTATSTLPSPAPPGVPRWAQVELTGRLPSGGPASGSVHTLPGGEAPEATVRALASALRLTGAPQRVTGGWRVTGPGTLQVIDGPGLRWTYLGAPLTSWCGPVLRRAQMTPGAPNTAGNGAGTGSNPRTAVPAALRRVCPMKPGQLEPFDPVPTPSGSAAPASGPSAQAAAMPVLQAVRVAGSPLRITTIGSFTFVSADPAVDGLPTAGFSTTVGVAPGDRITQASGWLSHPAAGSSYPLIGARQAFNRLKQSTHPIAGAHPPEIMCPLNPDTLCNPGPIRVVQVTGATYGLALSYNRGEPVLVPAWLFSVAGTSLKVPQVAINPRYLVG